MLQLLQASNGSFYWVHSDHLGSSHMLTDTSGSVAYRAEYDPHGNLRLETGTTTLTTRKFTGYERDAANLDYAQARTYGYRRGRFMQPDPLGLGAGDMANPQSLNLYSYVQNDPINATDPTGMLLALVCSSVDWTDWNDQGESVTGSTTVCTLVDIGGGGFGGGITGGPSGDSFGGGGGGGQQLPPAGPPIPISPLTRPDIHCQPNVITAMLKAWDQSKAGQTGVEAGFRLDGTPKKYKIVENDYTNEQSKQTLTINPSGPNKTFAIFHVHPSKSGGNPSTPENNYEGNKLGDTGLADKYRLQIYVMHRTGLTMYDPNTKQVSRLRNNLEWTKPCT